jgi:hypothetical protein
VVATSVRVGLLVVAWRPADEEGGGWGTSTTSDKEGRDRERRRVEDAPQPACGRPQAEVAEGLGLRERSRWTDDDGLYPFFLLMVMVFYPWW